MSKLVQFRFDYVFVGVYCHVIEMTMCVIRAL